jgi:hypothetical protein
LSVGCPCCTAIPWIVFSSRRRSSSPQLSTQPISTSSLFGLGQTYRSGVAEAVARHAGLKRRPRR